VTVRDIQTKTAAIYELRPEIAAPKLGGRSEAESRENNTRLTGQGLVALHLTSLA
jgi:hypothetical protein